MCGELQRNAQIDTMEREVDVPAEAKETLLSLS